MINIISLLATLPVLKEVIIASLSKVQNFRMKKSKTIEESPFEEGENTPAVFQLPSLETITTKEILAINELEESIAIAPGE